ncbi:MAG TPA: radical SAM family heme chaperone HemW [Bacteroidales bacterium]|nr:radical SAM family heme chaperone HemW [Bacteroidales bacterium]
MSGSFGLYLHIPFCKSKCAYCDFYSLCGTEGKTVFLDCLSKESGSEKQYIDGNQLSTIYFGGGTPSLLSANDYKLLFESIGREYDIGRCTEITLEANPDDLSPAYLKSISGLPFNRISIGIQSFNDRELRALGRRHDASQGIEAVGRCREAGLNNISIDLMFGIPEQNELSLQSNIEQALKLEVPHISVYMLSLEPGSQLYKDWQQGRFTEISDEEAEKHYFLISDQLKQAGYDHYEISNFARPGFRAIHNASYWSGRPYLGLGPSAHSFNGRTRRWNPASLEAYIQGIQNRNLIREEESLDLYTRYNELIMTHLRTSEGFSTDELLFLYGPELYDYCLEQARPLIAGGMLENTGGRIKLAYRAYFVSDSVIRALFWDDGKPDRCK